MRSIRSARVAASIGTPSFSFRIIRPRSCSCTTTTSLASVNSRLQKVTVNLVFRIEWWGYQERKRQKRFPTQMRSLRDLHLGAIRQQHPDRNLQSPPRWISDSDGSISSLRSAEDLKGSAMKWVERIEDLDGRAFCAQGIVSVGACIPTSTASCQAAASVPTARNGLVAGRKRSFSL
jgi:hypothetical protein